MSVSRLFYADTNILIMMFEGSDERRERLLTALLPKSNSDPALVTSLLTFAELLVGRLKAGNQDLVASYETIFQSDRFLSVVPVDQAVLRDAARLRALHRSLKLPDAIHIASAMHAGCTHLISDEDRFAKRFDLEIGRSSEPATIEVMRPDPKGLAALEAIANT